MKQRKDKGLPRIDLIGKKFNLLTVMAFVGTVKQGNNSVSFYKCICDCGKTKSVKGTHLTRGDTKSCGCLQHKRKTNDNAKSNAIFLSYRNHAKRRNLQWSLSFPFFDGLIRMRCSYCGDPPIRFNGVDRINNDVGYLVENSIPCCKICNRMKSDQTLDCFLNKVEAIYLWKAKY
jgi:hypothetical protein